MKRLVKRVSSVILLMLVVFTLAACNSTTSDDYKPEFQGFPENESYSFMTGDVFDPYADIFASDPVDGNLTDSIFVTGFEEMGLTSANVIKNSGTYELVYTVVNSRGYKVEKTITVIVTDFFEELAKYEVGSYELVFSDEFDYVGLPNSEDWNITNEGGGFGNFEYQYYTNREKNVYVDGEYLNLNLFKEDYNGQDYTSGKITTRDLHSFTYGKIEVRAKVPAGKGTWPAIWMMPNDSVYGTWPRSGEIDIMEHVGYDLNRIYGTIHVDEYNGMDGTQRGGNVVVDTATTEFHVYSIEWLPNKIIWSVDGEEYFTYHFAIDAYNDLEIDQYWRIWPYDQDFYLILNLAFGGTWGAAQGIDETLTEATMQIDYVRVYQAEITETN
jgi:beta-glucanase (GH16 family)